MAITVGTTKGNPTDKRISSYERINRNRGIRQVDLGKRTSQNKDTAQERVAEGKSGKVSSGQFQAQQEPATSMVQANQQASSEPEPIASAVEGGVIFSDGFRGSPVASSASGGTIYINNQDLPSNYERSFSRENNGNSFSSSNSVRPDKKTFTGTVSPAPPKESFFKAPISSTERLAEDYQSIATLESGVNPGRSFRYASGAFGLSVVSGSARFIESVLRLPDPTERGTISQTRGLLSRGYKEIKETGGLPSVGNYLLQNPSKAAADITLAAAAPNIPAPRFLRRFTPQVGVIGETIPETTVVNNPSSFKTRLRTSSVVEDTAQTALRTGTATDTETFIARLNRDVGSRVDVTSVSRLDNIMPSNKKNLVFNTRKSLQGKIDAVTGKKTRGFLTEANQNVPIDVAERLGLVESNTNKPTLRVTDTTERSRAISFRKSNAAPPKPEALSDFYNGLERPKYVDLNKALNKKYELYIDSAGKERIRLTQQAKQELATTRRLDFNERMRQELNPSSPQTKSLFPKGKKGQASLVPPETIKKETPSSILDKYFSRPKRNPSVKQNFDFEPPLRPNTNFVNDFIEEPFIGRYSRLLPLSTSFINASAPQSTNLLSLGSSKQQNFRTYNQPSFDVKKVTNTTSGISKSQSRSAAQSRTNSLSALSFSTPPPIINNVISNNNPPPTNSITKFYRPTESGGGNSGSYFSKQSFGSKKKFQSSFTGVELGLKASKKIKKYAGDTGSGLTGLEIRGI